MASPLSDAVAKQFKRVRGDDVLLRSERSTDPVDVLVVDGSLRQRTVARLTDYVQRDRPLAIVVSAMETDYVAVAMAKLDLTGYGGHEFSGPVTALDGT